MTEVILILVIMVVIFGMGKLPEIASRLGRKVSESKRDALRTVVDITPPRSSASEEAASGGRKPGRFDSGVEDARVEEGSS